jgi:hypothetical protein
MIHTVRRLFFVWDFEKQVKWLNDMAEKGLHLKNVGFGRFDFEEGEPGGYTYCMEWLRHRPGSGESVSYIKFLEETGAEYVASFKHWVYFRKQTTEGAFELFSDLDSRLCHLKRLMILMFCLIPLLLPAIALNIWVWVRFWETPNAVMAGALAVFLLFMINGLYKIASQYRNLKNERILHE